MEILETVKTISIIIFVAHVVVIDVLILIYAINKLWRETKEMEW
jgi:hypothetical protein